ncbi:MAG: Uma2 family endonuclease [Lachnospiraceae bacterium]|nr:Uma2 family endonuclease [Lachnospiraceae bacterium]
MALLAGENPKTEKIGGVIYNMSPSPNYLHGIVNNNINTIIKTSLKDSLCLVFMENLDFQYQPDVNDDYIIPDIMVVCDRKKIKGGSYTGVPKFIAETLRPSTSMRDLTVKKDIYEAAGVPEYWIVSPRECGVQIYYLDQGKYRLANSYILEDDKDDEFYNAETVISLRAFPHIHMTLADIFENVYPE